ncbi:MAG: DUF115 domain-containing protein [Betaproteobacteria bacterium]|nr:DUF115 domain-containing protein [Betaproteobacteria bacterium]
MYFFDLKQCVDNLMYYVFNFLSDAEFFLNPKRKALLAGNKAFHNKHAGERCFILGTGPSLAGLTCEQVGSLSKETVFAVNSIFKVYVVSSITPRYYALLDNNYWGVSKGTFVEVVEKYNNAPPVIITDIRAKTLVPNGVESILIYSKNYPAKRIRCDLSGNMSLTLNVVGSSILSAIYMGFNEVYLLGCDYNLFCSRIGTHCYNDDAEIKELPSYNLAFYLKYYHLITEFHYLISALAQRNGVKIINLTEGSLLDAYPFARVNTVL